MSDFLVPSQWLLKPKLNYIDGKWEESATPFPTVNPATEEILATVFAANERLVDSAVRGARLAFEKREWARTPLIQRAKVVREIGDLILKNRETLAVLESLDTGKPIQESFEGDIPRAASNFHFFADFALSQEPLIFESQGDRHEALREPLGVAALITPWNLPLYLETWKIAPALLMGNCVILKPSELTPLTATFLAELIDSTSLPKGVFQLVHGFGEKAAGEFLVSHLGIDAISFTGETGTGRAIMRSASKGPTRVSFELGGKGASVVFKDADLEVAVRESLRGAFRNQGEICLANSRIYVEKPVYDSFMEKFLNGVKEIQVGNPLDMKTTMGALISKEHYQKVSSYIEKAKSPAKITHGGKRPAHLTKGFFLEPTVIENLTKDHPITNEEIFGPVVSVYPFSSEEEAIQCVNQTQYGLSASVWTLDAARAKRVSERIRTGLVWVNAWFVRDLRVPFGGQKKSGIGREGGKHSLDFFSEWKSICYRGVTP